MKAKLFQTIFRKLSTWHWLGWTIYAVFQLGREIMLEENYMKACPSRKRRSIYKWAHLRWDVAVSHNSLSYNCFSQYYHSARKLASTRKRRSTPPCLELWGRSGPCNQDMVMHYTSKGKAHSEPPTIPRAWPFIPVSPVAPEQLFLGLRYTCSEKALWLNNTSTNSNFGRLYSF